MRICLYARVSTTEQTDKNLSIPDQIRQMKEFCQRYKHDIVATYREEGASASDDKRPQFQAMIEAIESGAIEVNGVLVLTTSRFFRNVYQAMEYKLRLRRLGIEVISVSGGNGSLDVESPMSEAFEIIAATFDHLESRNIGFHTARGMRENARRGFWNGNKTPFGYQVEKVRDEKGNDKSILKIDPLESQIVQRIFATYLENSLGGVEIAKALNRDGILRRGKKWSNQAVLRVLENRVYVGDYAYNKSNSRLKIARPKEEWIVMNVDTIVSDDVFEAAAELRGAKVPKKKLGRAYDGPLLFTGMLKCGHCGGSMVSSATKKKDKMYRYYACKQYLESGKDACPGYRIGVDALEIQMLNEVLNWIFSAEHVRGLLKAVRKAMVERAKPLRELKKQIGEVEKALARYQEGFEKGAFSMDDVAERFRELGQQKKALEAEHLSRSTVKELPASFSRTENIEHVRQALAYIFKTASHQVKKRWLNILIEYIIFNGDRIEVKARNDGIIAVLENAEGLEAGVMTEVISSSNKWRPQRDSNPCRRRERAVS